RSRVRFRMGGQAPLDLGANQFGDPGAVRNEAALSELTASHHQQAAISINIPQAESTDLSCAQTEPIAETEDDTIRGTTLPGSRVIRKSGRRGQQAAGLDNVEDEWNAACGHSTSPDL